MGFCSAPNANIVGLIDRKPSIDATLFSNAFLIFDHEEDMYCYNQKKPRMRVRLLILQPYGINDIS